MSNVGYLDPLTMNYRFDAYSIDLAKVAGDDKLLTRDEWNQYVDGQSWSPEAKELAKGAFDVIEKQLEGAGYANDGKVDLSLALVAMETMKSVLDAMVQFFAKGVTEQSTGG